MSKLNLNNLSPIKMVSAQDELTSIDNNSNKKDSLKENSTFANLNKNKCYFEIKKDSFE